ncbi:MAG: tRNA lysidine(34) synthetase TilS [Xanthomonadales bacterium]|nr:tRNA lysidine(34) synthetase TilS [Xanthomonadales bacterium]
MDRTRSSEDATVALTAAIEHALGDDDAQVWLGCSGGLDSTLLVHCAARSERLRALGLHVVHVHHGLHPDADHWAARVTAAAQTLGLRCTVRRVRVDARGQGIEAAARAARLAAFAAVLGTGERLLLAHHQDDQAETLLLRALRGASVDGLGAMRARRALGRGWLLRPWLMQPRARLRAAAAQLGIAWIEDPANTDPRHDRSWLRQAVWPLLASRFPVAGERFARLAAHAAAVADQMESLAAARLAELGDAEGTLCVRGLLGLDEALYGAVLRLHARRRGLAPPGFHELGCLREEVLRAAPDANPLRHWQGHVYCRYRDRLYLLAVAAVRPAPDYELEWPADTSSLSLPAGLGRLELVAADGASLPAPPGLWVRNRRGGERMRPAGGAHRRDLRLLLQERGLPPWERARLPLLWRGADLLEVPGVGRSVSGVELLGATSLRWCPASA